MWSFRTVDLLATATRASFWASDQSVTEPSSSAQSRKSWSWILLIWVVVRADSPEAPIDVRSVHFNEAIDTEQSETSSTTDANKHILIH